MYIHCWEKYVLSKFSSQILLQGQFPREWGQTLSYGDPEKMAVMASVPGLGGCSPLAHLFELNVQCGFDDC